MIRNICLVFMFAAVLGLSMTTLSNSQTLVSAQKVVNADIPPLPFGPVMALDGVDDYASAPDKASLDLGIGNTEDFTIETFFYVPNLTASTTQTPIWKQGAYGLYIIFSPSQPDRLLFRIWTGPISTSYLPLIYSGDLAEGWHHTAAVFDNEFTSSQDRIAIYLDGKEVVSSASFDLTPGLPNSSSAMNIGAYAGVNPFAGWLEEMRFSDIARYTGATYAVPAVPFINDANTRALWHFDDTPGSKSFLDSSGNGNTLTGLNGAQTFGSMPLRSDFNGDGAVNFDDFFLFASAFGQKATGDNAKFDLDGDGDGEIGFGDFFIFAAAFGPRVSGKPVSP